MQQTYAMKMCVSVMYGSEDRLYITSTVVGGYVILFEAAVTTYTIYSLQALLHVQACNKFRPFDVGH
jgi:hypothetical protein